MKDSLAREGAKFGTVDAMWAEVGGSCLRRHRDCDPRAARLLTCVAAPWASSSL